MEGWTIEQLEGKDVFVIEGQVAIPNNYSAGIVGSRFLVELRDNCRIMGIRCPKCDRCYVPPKSTCMECFGQLTEFVEVGKSGTLLTFTVDHHTTPVQTASPPNVYGIIKLDGADTGLLHLIGEVDGKAVKSGMRLEAVFNEERRGSILDIKYFRPAEAG